ncbi:MAG: Spy/CpxP family protein refolding chaperone [Halorhodospira sp.]
MADRVRTTVRSALGMAAVAVLLGSGIAAAQMGGMANGPMMMQPGMGPGMGMGAPMQRHAGMALGYGPCWDWMRGGFGGGLGDPRSPLWELDLEGEKLAKMRKLRRAYRELEAHIWVELAEKRDDMAELMAVERPDPEAVEELHARMAELQGELIAERVRMRNEMLGLLDEEQRQRFRQEFGPRR